MEEQLEAKKEEAKKYPYNQMAKFDWVPDISDPLKRVENLLQFFSVTSFDNIIEKEELKATFSISTKHSCDLPSLFAWLRQGVRQSENSITKDFNREKLTESLEDIRALTINTDPSDFLPKLTSILSECGIALEIVRSLKNVPVFGSTRWLSPKKALIQLSLRLKWADIFWFNLFHEIGHILYDNKKDFNIDFIDHQPNKDHEDRANKFAADTLIPELAYKEISEVISTSSNIYVSINRFAKKVGIHPGIVSGRLQRDKKIHPSFNRLRVRFGWVN